MILQSKSCMNRYRFMSFILFCVVGLWKNTDNNGSTIGMVQAQRDSPTFAPSISVSDMPSDVITLGFSGVPQCSANQYCAQLDLQGNCCPTNDGDILDCCLGSTAPVPAVVVSSDFPTPSVITPDVPVPSNGGTPTTSTSIPSDIGSDIGSDPGSDPGSDIGTEKESDVPSDKQTAMTTTIPPTDLETSGDRGGIETNEPTAAPSDEIAFAKPSFAPTPVSRSSAKATSITFMMNNNHIHILSLISIVVLSLLI